MLTDAEDSATTSPPGVDFVAVEGADSTPVFGISSCSTGGWTTLERRALVATAETVDWTPSSMLDSVVTSDSTGSARGVRVSVQQTWSGMRTGAEIQFLCEGLTILGHDQNLERDEDSSQAKARLCKATIHWGGQNPGNNAEDTNTRVY